MERGKIKGGFEIYLYYWTIPIFIGFLIINYYLPYIKIDTLDIGLMISVVSFLFGFLITITFSMLLGKVSELRETLALETGRLASIYLMSKHLGKEFHNKIRERLDKYTIDTLRDYTTYEKGREAAYGMYEDTKFIELKNDERQNAVVHNFFGILGDFETIREKLEYLTSRRVEWSLKTTNYVLGIILIILLFLNRGDSFTNSIFIVLSTITAFIFLILEDYDDLRLGDYTYNISNSEQLFDLIDKERYYPSDIIRRAKLEPGKTYRIGFVDKKTKKEKIYSIKYNPRFNSSIFRGR
ncbi:hypothetical protein HYV50_02220 [Candidatus Pacearchaeota archaeon]|nr:hypothetical protein [Candidatus Pacearchaeota archaeon]